MGGVVLRKSNKIKKYANRKEIVVTVLRRPSMKITFVNASENMESSGKPTLRRQRKVSDESTEQRTRKLSFVNLHVRNRSQTIDRGSILESFELDNSLEQIRVRRASSFNDLLGKQSPDLTTAVPEIHKSRKISLQSKGSMISNNIRKRFSTVSPPNTSSLNLNQSNASETPSKRNAWSLVSSFMNRKISDERNNKRILHKDLHSLPKLEQPIIVEQMLRFIINDECEKLKDCLNKLETTDIPGIKTLVHQAAYKGCSRCCYILLKEGFPIDRTDIEGWTPLHAAVLANNINTVAYLIPLYSSVNIVDTNGLSPLHIAIFKKNLPLVRLLVNASADIQLESQSKTPFQLAIDLKHTEILDYFISWSCSAKYNTIRR